MESHIGRFFEGRLYETTLLLKSIYDLGTGLGKDVVVSIDGRELVFCRKDKPGRGFLRIIPQEAQLIVAFPRGHALFDPKKRTKGPPNAQTTLTVRQGGDLDIYFRRLLDSAYAAE